MRTVHDDPVTLSSLLAQKRPAGASYREWADNLGVQVSVLTAWLTRDKRGFARPKPNRYEMLMELLGVTLDELGALIARAERPDLVEPSTLDESFREIERAVATGQEESSRRQVPRQ